MKMQQHLPIPQSYVICPVQKKAHLAYIDDKRPSTASTQKTLQVIQRAPFGKFIKNLSEDRESKDLILYTYVLADGGGDQGMLQNLSKIFQKYKPRLGYKNQKLYAVYAPGFKGERAIRTNKDGQNEYSDDSRGLLPTKGANDYEIQCPVPDPATREDEHLTKVYEMGKDGTSPFQNAQETTIAQDSSRQREVGMIIPDNPERGDEENLNKASIQNQYLSDQLNNCTTIGDARQKLQNIAVLNVREGGEEGAADFPPSDRIHTFLTRTGKTKALLLREPDDMFGDTEIICIGKIPHEELQYFQSILPESALIVSGGEAFFSESMAPGVKAGKLFAPRYGYQYAVLQHTIDQMPTTTPEETEQKDLAAEGIEILAQLVFPPDFNRFPRPAPRAVQHPQEALNALQAIVKKMKDSNLSKTIEENLPPTKRSSFSKTGTIIAVISILGLFAALLIKKLPKKTFTP